MYNNKPFGLKVTQDWKMCQILDLMQFVQIRNDILLVISIICDKALNYYYHKLNSYDIEGTVLYNFSIFYDTTDYNIHWRCLKRINCCYIHNNAQIIHLYFHKLPFDTLYSFVLHAERSKIIWFCRNRQSTYIALVYF